VTGTDAVILGEIVAYGLVNLLISKVQWDRFFRRFDARTATVHDVTAILADQEWLENR